MDTFVNVLSQRFGKLVVIAPSSRKSKAGKLWECACDCGGQTTTTSLKLRNGYTKSCGCYGRSRIALVNFKHGYSLKSNPIYRTYKTWKLMRQRCLSPSSTQWKWYGGRGIKITDEWNNFEKFLSDMGIRPEGKTLDRIESDGDYTSKNCKWSTPKEQAGTNRGCFKKGQIPHNKKLGLGGLRTYEKVKDVHNSH